MKARTRMAPARIANGTASHQEIGEAEYISYPEAQ